MLSEKIRGWLDDASMYSSSNLLVLRGNKIVYLKNYESLAEDNVDTNISSNLMLEVRK